MPIYEYSCQACGHQFELLVFKKTKPACPSCEGNELERRISLPTVQSSTTKAAALRAAKKRDKALGKDRMHEQWKYEQAHED